MSDTRHLEALARLRNDQDFKLVLEWVESLREKAKENLTTANASVIQQFQGRAQAYAEVLNTAKNAADILAQGKRPPSPGHL